MESHIAAMFKLVFVLFYFHFCMLPLHSYICSKVTIIFPPSMFPWIRMNSLTPFHDLVVPYLSFGCCIHLVS